MLGMSKTWDQTIVSYPIELQRIMYTGIDAWKDEGAEPPEEIGMRELSPWKFEISATNRGVHAIHVFQCNPDSTFTGAILSSAFRSLLDAVRSRSGEPPLMDSAQW